VGPLRKKIEEFFENFEKKLNFHLREYASLAAKCQGNGVVDNFFDSKYFLASFGYFFHRARKKNSPNISKNPKKNLKKLTKIQLIIPFNLILYLLNPHTSNIKPTFQPTPKTIRQILILNLSPLLANASPKMNPLPILGQIHPINHLISLLFDSS
jgi:hypothetical protein